MWLLSLFLSVFVSGSRGKGSWGIVGSEARPCKCCSLVECKQAIATVSFTRDGLVCSFRNSASKLLRALEDVDVDTKGSRLLPIKCSNSDMKGGQLGRDSSPVGGYSSSCNKEKVKTPGLMEHSLIYREVVHLRCFT